MSDSDDQILAEELGKVGELGAKLGALLHGDALDENASREASLAAHYAAKFLPTESHSEKVRLSVSPEKAIKPGFSVLRKMGELKADDGPKPPYPLLKAVVGSGFLDMNPAVVYLEIFEGDATGCEVTITAAAKEGLIKQRTAAKAVERIASALKQDAAGA
jgi:hypothetical protein